MEDCPCCNGTGQCQVSLAGFDTWWTVDCVDCGGKGRVNFYHGRRLRIAMAERVARGLPRIPPGGLPGTR